MKNLRRLIPVLVLLAASLPAQTGAGTEHGAGTESTTAGQGEPRQKTLKEMKNKELFVGNFIHLLPHPLFGSGAGHGGDSHSGPGEVTFTTFYDNNLFQLISVVLILLIFTGVKGSFRDGSNSGFAVRVFRGWCHWLRDEVVYPVMGPEEGRKWAPFFLYLFFFIAFMNLLGLVPVIGKTATASYYVTGSMAAIIFASMLGFGFRQQGFIGFFVNLLPHGLPVALIPLMAFVELVGLVIKPCALMVRLFANMLGGHMVTYAFLGMIFLFAKMFDQNVFLSSLTAIPAVGMGVFISIIEGFIALLQAYVFTFLSVMFIQQSMHPVH